MSVQLVLPEETYERLQRAAQRSGSSVEGWIAARAEAELAAAPTDELPADELSRAISELLAASHDYGIAFGTDNDEIDADLARAYADNHEPPE